LKVKRDGVIEINILVTGGASGLGEAITKKLAGDSSNYLFFTYYNSRENAGKIKDQFKNTKGLYCDFGEPDSVTKLLNHMEDMHLDLLVNNALVSLEKKHFQKMDHEMISQSFQKNVIPVLRITQKAISEFRQKNFGRIINILTEALINVPPIGFSEYAANKAYLESMSKSWAAENMNYGITSNCISPSLMVTNLMKDTDERLIDEIAQKSPMGKLLTIEEVADVVYFMANSSPHLNGVNLVMNGGKNVI
jgi:NAD(P)-dependent dehydrogenase (short-subunit alcohol dehydrogenase family)